MTVERLSHQEIETIRAVVPLLKSRFPWYAVVEDMMPRGADVIEALLVSMDHHVNTLIRAMQTDWRLRELPHERPLGPHVDAAIRDINAAAKTASERRIVALDAIYNTRGGVRRG